MNFPFFGQKGRVEIKELVLREGHFPNTSAEIRSPCSRTHGLPTAQDPSAKGHHHHQLEASVFFHCISLQSTPRFFWSCHEPLEISGPNQCTHPSLARTISNGYNYLQSRLKIIFIVEDFSQRPNA
jgi:hypothetical protein